MDQLWKRPPPWAAGNTGDSGGRRDCRRLRLKYDRTAQFLPWLPRGGIGRFAEAGVAGLERSIYGSTDTIGKLCPAEAYAGMFAEGLAITVLLALFTVLIGFILALLLALMRMSNFRPFRALA